MSVDTMAAEEDGRREGRKEGADRERRRIRRALARACKREGLLCNDEACNHTDCWIARRVIADATRAKKGKRK